LVVSLNNIIGHIQTWIDPSITGRVIENLLFNYDWNYTTHCFDRSKKTSSKNFAERTRNALEAEGITPTADDLLVAFKPALQAFELWPIGRQSNAEQANLASLGAGFQMTSR